MKINESKKNDIFEKRIRIKIQNFLDATAKEYLYRDIETAIGYRGDPNPKFNQEANMFFNWRSVVWTFVNQEMIKIKNKTRSMPESEEAILAELPKIENYA